MRPKDLREKRSHKSFESASIQNQNNETLSPSTKDSSYCELQRKHIKEISHQKLIAESKNGASFESVVYDRLDEVNSNDSYEVPIDTQKITLSSGMAHLFGSVDDKDLIETSGLKTIEPKLNSFRQSNRSIGSSAEQDKSYSSSKVRGYKSSQKNTLAIDRWIETVYNLHRSKPNTAFEYSHPMPSMNETLSAFPERTRDTLAATKTKKGDGLETSVDPGLDISLEEYIRIICAILDIPVRDGYLIESLHYLFQAYIQVRSKEDAFSIDEVSDP
jgi:hypothetical protein